MQMMFSNRVLGMMASLALVATASAHPGHSPSDPVAQVSAPLAGWDHLTAFVALSTILLFTLRVVVKHRAAQKAKVRK